MISPTRRVVKCYDGRDLETHKEDASGLRAMPVSTLCLVKATNLPSLKAAKRADAQQSAQYARIVRG